MSFDDWRSTEPDNRDDAPEPESDGTMCEICCDEDATTFIDRGEGFAYWTGQPRKLPACAACAEKHDNAEPDDLTYDEKLARVSEAYEQMAEAFRQKR